MAFIGLNLTATQMIVSLLNALVHRDSKKKIHLILGNPQPPRLSRKLRMVGRQGLAGGCVWEGGGNLWVWLGVALPLWV